MLETIIYILIFLMGTFFGSFFTLAVYRIPLGENITHKHSFCPNCKHKLGILDLIPIISYIFLGGKCRYCKNKIKPRYLLLEILSGIVFVLLAISIRINLYNIEIYKIAHLVFFILYFCSLFIIAGIDKEKKTIQRSVLLYGIVVVTMYITYLYMVEKTNIYRYVIYLLIILVLVIIDTIKLRKKAESNYTVQILILCMYMSLFAGEEICILTIIYTLLAIAIYLLGKKILEKNKKYNVKEVNEERMPIGFFLCVTNVILIICMNFIINYIV